MQTACEQAVGSASPKVPFRMGDEIPTGPVVYFLAANARVKIGYTANFAKRFRNLSTASSDPLTVIGAVKGDRKLEGVLHALLQAHRVNGEWFEDCARVKELIHLVLSGAELPKVPKRVVGPLIQWASEAVRRIASPVYGERIPTVVQRAADRCGLPYWRMFDLWYAKARRLEISERDAILAALGGTK